MFSQKVQAKYEFNFFMNYKDVKHNGETLQSIPLSLTEQPKEIFESYQLRSFLKQINDFPNDNLNNISEPLNSLTSYLLNNKNISGDDLGKFELVEISNFIIHFITDFKETNISIMRSFLSFFTSWTFFQNNENNYFARKDVFEFLFEYMISSQLNIELRTLSLMSLANILIDSHNMRTILQDFVCLNGTDIITQSANESQNYLLIQITFQIMNIIFESEYIETEKMRTVFEYVSFLVINNAKMLSDETIRFIRIFLIKSEYDRNNFNNLIFALINNNFVKLIFEKVPILEDKHQLINQLLMLIQTMIKETYCSYEMNTRLREQIDFETLYNFFKSNEKCSISIKNSLCDFLASYYNSTFVTPFLNEYEFKIMNDIIIVFAENEYVLRDDALELYFILFTKSRSNDLFNPLAISPISFVSFLYDMIESESEETTEKVFSILDIFMDLVDIYPIYENGQEVKEKIKDIIEYALNGKYNLENTASLLLQKLNMINSN